MKHSRRQERVEGALREEISRIVLRVVKDPRIQGVTLTGVRVSPDLRLARVYYSVLGDRKRQEDAARGLESARGRIKRELGGQLRLRYMPEIEFLFDHSLQHAEHIQKLLNEIHEREGEGPEEGP